MANNKPTNPTRRDLIKTTGAVAAASTLAGVALPQVHAGENNTIKVVLIGCGGRGTGAAANAMSTRHGPVQLVAMADTFRDRLDSSFRNLQRTHARRMDVPANRRFIGFNAYRQAMDCLREGDVAIFATPPAFRWVHFTYAIQKRLNVFMEKPVTVDGPSTRRMFRLAQESERLNLKVGVGLMCRHCEVRGELHDRIQRGQMGDILFMRAYRMQGPIGSCFSGAKPADMDELEYQIRHFHSFLWASGGSFSDFFIHNIDECCWMKDAWPVKARASGGRHYRGDNIDQNFDHYSVEYTFGDGTKLYLDGRNIARCQNRFASYAHGSRGSAIISRSSHFPARSRIHRGQDLDNNNDIVWRGPREENNPYQLEWDNLINAIRRGNRYNEVRRGAEASLITAMGRMAAHTGQVVTRDQALASDHELGPTVDRLTINGPSPLRAGADGKYPVPGPGSNRMREF